MKQEASECNSGSRVDIFAVSDGIVLYKVLQEMENKKKFKLKLKKLKNQTFHMRTRGFEYSQRNVGAFVQLVRG